MFCNKCGCQVTQNSKFCDQCGNAMPGSEGRTFQPIEGQAAPSNFQQNVELQQPFGNSFATGTRPTAANPFFEAITTCLKKYFDFNGRSKRGEYWWFNLAYIPMSIIASVIYNSGTLNGLLLLAFISPFLSVGARRLHDTNRSGWWQLLGLTGIGILPLLFWLTMQGDSTANKYGNAV